MPSAPYDLSISAARADALVASPLQRSDEPSTRQVRQAIATAIPAYGMRGCATQLTQDYGEHPETADALTAHGSGQRIRQLPDRADPHPRTRPLHRALCLPVPPDQFELSWMDGDLTNLHPGPTPIRRILARGDRPRTNYRA